MTLERLPAVKHDSFKLSEWDELTSGRVFLHHNAVRWPRYARGHRLVMSHYPMLSWNGKARGAIMLHGHIHSRGDRTNARNRDRALPTYRYDVGLDANDYKPVSRDQILSFFGL